ncbi:peptidase S1, partial [Micromonospora sp. AB353]
MAVQTGLGEPRGPWFVSPELDPDGRGHRDVPGGGPEAGRRSLRHRLLSVAAVVALSTVSGAAAGTWA